MPGAPSHGEFARAAEQFAAQPNSTEAIADMMRTAMEAEHPTRRRWAAQWLRQHCNILVETEAGQEQDDATSTQAASIL